jgi:hypothetical protein
MPDLLAQLRMRQDRPIASLTPAELAEELAWLAEALVVLQRARRRNPADRQLGRDKAELWRRARACRARLLA